MVLFDCQLLIFNIRTISKVHLISNQTCYNEIAQIGFISSLRDTGPVA